MCLSTMPSSTSRAATSGSQIWKRFCRAVERPLRGCGTRRALPVDRLHTGQVGFSETPITHLWQLVAEGPEEFEQILKGLSDRLTTWRVAVARCRPARGTCAPADPLHYSGGVAGEVVGSSATQVGPGARGITLYALSSSVVGEPGWGCTHLPVMTTPLRATSAGPEPTAPM